MTKPNIEKKDESIEKQQVQKVVCPQCNWGSRVNYMARSDSYKCGHCGKTWRRE